MKKIILIFIAAMLTVSMMAQDVPTVVIKGDLNQYKYVYVIPTSGTTSSSGISTSVHIWGPFFTTIGNGTSTANPSEVLSGFFMKEGFTVVPSITPEITNKALIVSYGFLGADGLYSKIILQVTDANTHETIASYETSGKALDEAEQVSRALDYAMELLRYTLHPHVDFRIEDTSSRALRICLSNRTPYLVSEVQMRLSYYIDGELIHNQEVTVPISLLPAYTIMTRVKREKEYRGYKYKVEVQMIDYK